MSNDDRFPKRIRVVNETGKPFDSDIFDADTGERVMGVFEVHITRKGIDVIATLHWPTTPDDMVVLDHDYDGPSMQGTKTTEHTYQVKRLELESW